MTTKAERQQEWKSRHLKALAELGFTGSYRTLRTLENRMRNAALSFCNDSNYDEDKLEAMKDKTRADVAKLFGGTLPNGFIINSDPRGYALKIDNELAELPQGLHHDFGGYGILAPEEF